MWYSILLAKSVDMHCIPQRIELLRTKHKKYCLLGIQIGSPKNCFMSVEDMLLNRCWYFLGFASFGDIHSRLWWLISELYWKQHILTSYNQI